MAGPTLTENLDGNPWVEVFHNPADLDPTCTRLRLYRYSEDRVWLVRGGVDVAPGVAAIDFEVPFQTLATYRAEQFNSSGVSLGFTDTSSITLDVSGTWVHQPLQPLLAAQVELNSTSAPEITRPTPADRIYTEGSFVARHIGRGRQGLVGVSVSFAAFGDQADAFQTILGTYVTRQVAVLCIRTSDPVRWPRTFFASSDALTEQDVSVRFGGDWVDFTGKLDEVAPPFSGLVVPLLTYGDLDAAYATYALRDAAYATYTEQDRDYSLAGLADQ